MRLRVQGEGPLVVKLPGLAGGVELYRETIDAAAAAGFRIAALETSGDRWDDPAGGRLSWDGLSGEVFAALDRLGAERAVLWGTSFGCLIALAAAGRRPERISGLLLGVPPEPGWLPAPYRASLEWVLRRREPDRASARALRWAMILLCGWEFLAPTSMRRLPGLYRASLEAATPAGTYRDKLRLLLEDASALRLPDGGVPVSILAGSWDLLVPCRGARRLAQRIPSSRLHVFGAAGHCVSWSRPVSYARSVVRELRELAGAELTSPRGPA